MHTKFLKQTKFWNKPDDWVFLLSIAILIHRQRYFNFTWNDVHRFKEHL